MTTLKPKDILAIIPYNYGEPVHLKNVSSFVKENYKVIVTFIDGSDESFYSVKRTKIFHWVAPRPKIDLDDPTNSIRLGDLIKLHEAKI